MSKQASDVIIESKQASDVIIESGCQHPTAVMTSKGLLSLPVYEKSMEHNYPRKAVPSDVWEEAKKNPHIQMLLQNHTYRVTAS